jgi:hypothetical protein
LALIVYGHVAAGTSTFATPPVYQKQLGVAFFVFAMGFTLAREQRPRWRVAYNRAFEVWAFGLLFALLMSAIGLAIFDDASESNYLPVFGISTLAMNDFPANPTTWYIGTYIHLLLVWALVLRRVRITLPVLSGVLISEIVVRAILIAVAGRFTAYMFLGNWITLLLVGMWMEQRDSPAVNRSKRSAAALLGAVAVGWPLVANTIPWRATFPFMDLRVGPWTSAVVVSAVVSVVYLGYTLATFGFARTLPSSSLARFFARNTVVVFIAHMPIYYLLEWSLRARIPTYGWRVTFEFLICFVALACVSEMVRAVLQPDRLREGLGMRLAPLLDGTRKPARIQVNQSVGL